MVQRYPALLWFLAIQLAALAVTPMTLLLFRRLPDRGYLLAKPMGLMLLAYPVWLLVSIKAFHFERLTILAWLIVLAGSGLVLAARQSDELVAFFKQRWRLLLLGEALFAGAFLLFYWFRIENPDLWHPWRGGEKPMDVAYLTAVIRSTTLPPYDPWFAGGYINYYYLGHFFTATVSKLLGIAPERAFNLAIPMYFAMAVGASFSVSYNLAAAGRNLIRRAPGLRPLPVWGPIVAGLLGAVLVALVGNLDSVGQLTQRLSAVNKWDLSVPVPLLDPLLKSVGGLYQVAFNDAKLAPFDYWRPSRMMPPAISITEFPMFSFLFADLHAHVMAIPFSILTIGAALALALSSPSERTSQRDWLLIALLGLITGSLRWLNSWDYPPFLLLALAGVVISERRAEGGAAATLAWIAAKSLLMVGLSFAFYLPFLDNYTSPVSGLSESRETTPIHQYLAHFGILLAPVVLWLIYQLYRALRATSARGLAAAAQEDGPAGLWGAYERSATKDQVWLSAMVTCGLMLAGLCILYASRGDTVIAAMIPTLAVLLYVATREFRLVRADGGLRLFVLALLGLAFGLSLSVDLVTINGDIQRMNTVFKFYLHIWFLLAIAASFARWYLFSFTWSPPAAGPRRALRLAPRFAGSAALGLLLLAGLIYPLAATPVRLEERFTDLPNTLDGSAYMAEAVFGDPHGPIALGPDYEGILWLRENVQGTPTIMEGHISDLYRWGGRFSIYTGLPTVLGWDWHQRQQRGQFAPLVDARARQVKEFYTSPDPRQAISTLSQYDIEYVIVGQLESLYFPRAGLAKFEQGLDGTLEVAYRNESLTIYRVTLDPGQLALKGAAPNTVAR